MKLAYWMPLVGYVVPTLVIGFGFVIPGSPIAGINELTLGFLGTVAGAAVTYVVGIGLVVQSTKCTLRRSPWVRFWRQVGVQARQPSGAIGRLLFRIMSWETRKENAEAIDRLDLAPHHAVLEVGFGHGRTFCALLKRTPRGHVTGIDWSGEMVAVARRRFAAPIAQGRLEVLEGDAGHLPLADGTVDRILSTHTVYFWADPEAVLRELRRVARPGGRMVLTFAEPDAAFAATRFPAPTYTFRGEPELTRAARAAGWGSVTARREAQPKRTMVWLTLEA
jgi:SAM-dependent methyltransferase